MKKMKVLNLYAGIGGNRKLWENVEVTAVENNWKIAMAYKKFFPMDTMIVGDAHEYLLTEYKKFDFIWSSPPCPTHSDIRRCGVHKGQYPAIYPDMKLYEEIILLQHFAKCKWVVENVRGYYNPLIKPFEVNRHYFWSNFIIANKKDRSNRLHTDIVGSEPIYGFDLKGLDLDNKRRILRNLVNPELGKHIFDCAFKVEQKRLLEVKND